MWSIRGIQEGHAAKRIGHWTQDQKVWGLISIPGHACVEVSGKLRIPHYLSSPSRNGYLIHNKSKVGLICAPNARGSKV